MPANLKRAILPLLLLVLGAGLIVIGSLFHSQEVLAQIEQKAPKLSDLDLDRPAWMRAGPVPADTTPQYVATWIDEPEPLLIREITIGGLTLAEDRRLKRTYTGDMPSLCPT